MDSIQNSQLPIQNIQNYIQPTNQPNKKWFFFGLASLIILMLAGGIIIYLSNQKPTVKFRITDEDIKQKNQNTSSGAFAPIPKNPQPEAQNTPPTNPQQNGSNSLILFENQESKYTVEVPTNFTINQSTPDFLREQDKNYDITIITSPQLPDFNTELIIAIQKRTISDATKPIQRIVKDNPLCNTTLYKMVGEQYTLNNREGVIYKNVPCGSLHPKTIIYVTKDALLYNIAIGTTSKDVTYDALKKYVDPLLNSFVFM